MEFSHISVLFSETVESLNIKPDGLYVDCTCGGAGHSRAILDRLNENGRLIAIDRDPDAIEVINERIGGDSRVTVVNANFFDIKSVINGQRADGILADLGVSSFQLDNPERGFSYHKDAPLDMRMSKQGKSACDIVNTYSEKELCDIIRRWGEEKYANSIAKSIVKAREQESIETTLQLAEIVKNSVPMKARRDSHPARKTFQALRIEVNGELSGLARAVEDMFDCLNSEGRLSIITFHSLEDRAVKQTMKSFCEGCTCPKDFPVCVCGKTPRGKLINKGISAGEAELASNNRSRSARLRTVEKI